MKSDASNPESNSPLNKALKYLSYRQRSTKEIREYLTKKKFSEDEINEVIKKLNDYNFLNDTEFAKLFSKSKQEKGKSKRVISMELKQKGIDKETAEETLEEVQDDIQTARNYIEKRLDSLNKLPQDEMKKKIINRLKFRGFNWDVISKILEEIKTNRV